MNYKPSEEDIENMLKMVAAAAEAAIRGSGQVNLNIKFPKSPHFEDPRLDNRNYGDFGVVEVYITAQHRDYIKLLFPKPDVPKYLDKAIITAWREIGLWPEDVEAEENTVSQLDRDEMTDGDEWG